MLLLIYLVHKVYFLFQRNGTILDQVLETGEFQGIDLKGSKPAMAYKAGLIEKLALSITERLAPKEPIIEATKIANMRAWPLLDEEVEGLYVIMT